MNESTQDKIKMVLWDLYETDMESIHEDTRLNEDLDIDSLDKVELMIHCEKVIGVKIPDYEIEPITTFGELVACVESKLPAPEAAQ